MSSYDRYQPPASLLHKTALTGFSYHSPQHRRIAAARSLSSGNPGYNSLPRRSGSKDAPCNLSHARRKLVNNALQDYLKSLNAMTRSIVLETESVEKEHHGDWKELDPVKKEDLVNDHFVPTDVRLQYEADRSSSCCSFSSARSLGRFSSREDVLVPQNRSSLHSAQPSSDWDEPKQSPSDSPQYSNDWSSAAASDREDPGVSQTSPDNYPSNFERLHKTQLSFRPNHNHAIKTRLSVSQNRLLPAHTLGSDGESQRTSDDDYESNPLGFQRSKLRSFSMRSRKATGSNAKGFSNLRSSVRTSHKIRTNPDGEESKNPSSFEQSCRPSHCHTYSTTSTDTDFDEEIDMPDDALRFDHIPCRKISADETDSETGFQQSSADHFRIRRSFRNNPKISLEEIETSEISILGCENENIAKVNGSTSSFSAELRVPSSCFFRSHSQESIDMDSVSMAPSDSMSMAPSELSKFDEESLADPSRMTPESFLSVSTYSSRSKSQAIMRNRRGKRGGSHVRVATSEFADRHSQFKNNMLQRHQLDTSSSRCQTPADTTRASSPAYSVASSILTPTANDTTPSHSHQEPLNLTFSPNHSKHSSMAESTTSDLPRSPSVLSSPPTTPLTVGNYIPYNHVFRKSLSPKYHEHRESGYISSSSESFPVAGRR